MWRERNRILKTATRALFTVLRVSGSALGSIYDKGVILAGQSLTCLQDRKQSEREFNALKSMMKIVTLNAEIARERTRLKYFGVVRWMKK